MLPQGDLHVRGKRALQRVQCGAAACSELVPIRICNRLGLRQVELVVEEGTCSSLARLRKCAGPAESEYVLTAGRG